MNDGSSLGSLFLLLLPLLLIGFLLWSTRRRQRAMEEFSAGLEAGDEILVEKLDAEVGAEVAFEVLMLCGDEVVVGKPVVEGVTAKATVVDQVKGKKVVVFHYKPKKNIRKKQGHRQPYTKVKIESIG